MNQLCKVCGELAAGYHFGAFTCEGCKSFFGRTYNNSSSIGECKNNNQCSITKKNRTSCKSCRLRKCFNVGMSKSGSRYGRRSNWFKIHCLIQDHDQAADAAGLTAVVGADSEHHGVIHQNPSDNSSPHEVQDLTSVQQDTASQLHHHHHHNHHQSPVSNHQRQQLHHTSPAVAAAAAAAAANQLLSHQSPVNGAQLHHPSPLGLVLPPDAAASIYQQHAQDHQQALIQQLSQLSSQQHQQLLAQHLSQQQQQPQQPYPQNQMNPALFIMYQLLLALNHPNRTT